MLHRKQNLLLQQCFYGWVNGETFEETSKISNVSVTMFLRVGKRRKIWGNIENLKCFGKNVSTGGQTEKYLRKHRKSQMFLQKCFYGWANEETFEETSKISNLQQCFLVYPRPKTSILTIRSPGHACYRVFMGWTGIH